MELRENLPIPVDAIPWDSNISPTFCAAKTGAHLLLGVRLLLQGFLGVLCVCGGNHSSFSKQWMLFPWDYFISFMDAG